MPKPFEQLTFSDDWMFQKVLQDSEICGELVNRLLHINVDHVEYPELEKVIEPFYTSTENCLLPPLLHLQKHL